MMKLNIKIKNKNNTSGYSGVYWDKANNKWRSLIKVDRKSICLGRYVMFEDAVKARKKAEEEMREILKDNKYNHLKARDEYVNKVIKENDSIDKKTAEKQFWDTVLNFEKKEYLGRDKNYDPKVKFNSLDKITGGFAEQELRVISGHTSTGKTTWTMNEMLIYARQGIPVCIFSLESPVKKVIKDIPKENYKNILKSAYERQDIYIKKTSKTKKYKNYKN